MIHPFTKSLFFYWVSGTGLVAKETIMYRSKTDFLHDCQGHWKDTFGSTVLFIFMTCSLLYASSKYYRDQWRGSLHNLFWNSHMWLVKELEYD